MAVYITKQGDTADYIAWAHYGRQDRLTVEQVLDANPGLADMGPEYPPNIRVTLPVLAAPTITTGVKLWD